MKERDCENCVHHTDNGCSSWDCEYKPNDLISRVDALEQMAQAECGLHYDDCEADNCSCSYIQRILDIPSADAVHIDLYRELYEKYIGLKHKTEWIPCREMLPNDTKDVLVCMRNGWIYIASYRHSRRLWKFDADGYADCEIVRAWMPLPTPYKGGDEE